jgi:ABC-2 type transport system permease protein
VRDLTLALPNFLRSLISSLGAWPPLIAYLLIVRRYVENVSSSVDIPALVSTYLGLLLIGSLFIAMGCFASALTRSQLVAAIMSYALVFTLFLLGMRSLVSVEASGWEAVFFSFISLTEHMLEVARGVVQLSSVCYYITLTTFFLFLTWKVVESRRWK